MTRLINAEQFSNLFWKLDVEFRPSQIDAVFNCLNSSEPVGAAIVTRCKDCKWCRVFYHGPDMQFSYDCAKLYLTGIGANDFCSKAERKDNA